MPRKAKRDPLLVEVIAAIGAGRMWRGFVRAKNGEILYGCMNPDGEILVNEPYAIVEILAHEAIHRMRRRWSEDKVKAKTAELLKELTDADIEALHGIYLTHVVGRVVRTKKRTV